VRGEGTLRASILPWRRIGFVALLGTFASLGLILLAFIAAFVWAISESRDDTAHSDHAHFAARFEEARERIQLRTGTFTLDMSPLNGGSWTTACLLGGYARAADYMASLGAAVSEQDRERLGSSVRENEVVIGFIDPAGEGRFIRFRRGIGVAGQWHVSCVSKPQTLMELR
jgi:hypothetical protein